RDRPGATRRTRARGNIRSGESNTGRMLCSRTPMAVTDCHIHVQPWWELKAHMLEAFGKGRADIDELPPIMKSPERLLKKLDAEGIDRAVLVNYPAPDVMGFGHGVNDYVAEYC